MSDNKTLIKLKASFMTYSSFTFPGDGLSKYYFLILFPVGITGRAQLIRTHSSARFSLKIGEIRINHTF